MGERWAVVTGASRGIGEAIARRLAADGFAIALAGRDREALDAVAGDLDNTEVYVADLASRAAVDALTAELRRRHPALAVLVNNAGIAHVGPVAEQGGEAWDATLEVNLRAPFELMRALEPALAAADDGAAVVNVGSMGAVMAHGGVAAYAAAKAGLQHLTKAIAVEWAPLGIRVNAIAPSSTRTPMYERAHPPARKRALERAHPLGRVATTAEVAGVVSFLCSPDSAFMTGVVLPIDGGLGVKYAIPDLD